MSFYQSVSDFGSKYVARHKLFKYGFNLSPMYRRSTGKVTHVSPNLLEVKVKLKISYKNRNYVSSIFGGSMFSAVDPMPMVQLINILGNDYVVWDKSAEIFFKKPARQDLYADFVFTQEEIDDIKSRVAKENEIEMVRTTELTDQSKETLFCTVNKTLYIASNDYYKAKRARATKIGSEF